MTDPRAGKTFNVSWPRWLEYCKEMGLDPWDSQEHGVDLGGGDSFTVGCFIVPDELDHLCEIQDKLDNFNRRRWRGRVRPCG